MTKPKTGSTRRREFCIGSRNRRSASLRQPGDFPPRRRPWKFPPTALSSPICARVSIGGQFLATTSRWSSILVQVTAASRSPMRGSIPASIFWRSSGCSGVVRKIEKRAARAQLLNLRVLRLEFGYTVRYLLPPRSIAIATSCFPIHGRNGGHWPRRLMQPEFVRDLAAVLRPGGELRFTTDHEHYFETAQQAVADAKVLQRAPDWNWANDRNRFSADLRGGGPSHLARALGEGLSELVF